MIKWMLVTIFLLYLNLGHKHDNYFGCRFTPTKKQKYLRYMLSFCVSGIMYGHLTRETIPFVLDAIVTIGMPVCFLWWQLSIIESIKLTFLDYMTEREAEEQFVLKKIGLYYFTFVLFAAAVGVIYFRYIEEF